MFKSKKESIELLIEARHYLYL